MSSNNYSHLFSIFFYFYIFIFFNFFFLFFCRNFSSFKKKYAVKVEYIFCMDLRLTKLLNYKFFVKAICINTLQYNNNQRIMNNILPDFEKYKNHYT
jgi:hypothetical protein